MFIVIPLPATQNLGIDWNCSTLSETFCVVWMEKEFKTDRYLFPHTAYFIREMRIKAYSQLLESYRSLSLLHMAQTFGVSERFIDRYVCIIINVGIIILIK